MGTNFVSSLTDLVNLVALFQMKTAPKPDLEPLEKQATNGIRQIVSLILDDHASSIKRGSAAWCLHRLAYLAVENLGLIAKKKPELIRPIAETSMVWPALISPHGDFAKSNEQLMERLHVGRCSLLRIVPKKGQKKQWSFLTPATQIAQTLIREIEGLRCYYRAKNRTESDPEMARINKKHGFSSVWKSLPTDLFAEAFSTLKNFNAQTAPEWFDAGWKIIMQQTGGCPEKFFNLERMGEHRRKHSEYEGAQIRVTMATGNSNVRDGFRDRLKKAFLICARQPEVLPRYNRGKLWSSACAIHASDENKTT